MLSIDDCKAVLEAHNEQFTDEEVEQIRELLYQMAKAVVDASIKMGTSDE